MKDIHKGKIQLPDFQRGWVWDDYNICALIASITNNFPIGVAMFLEYGNPAVKFQYRMIEGAENLKVQPEKLILDGQQRLTAIYLSMYSEKPVKTKNEKDKNIERYYYIDIEKALDSNCDRIDAIISVPKEKLITKNFGKDIVLDLTSAENEYKNKMFPLNIVFDATKTMIWQMNFTKDLAAQQIWINFYNEILSKLPKYQIPVTVLEKETSKEAVCQVFENVNTGGIKLTAFELVTATFAMDNFQLRADWKKRKDKNFSGDILKVVTETDFLTACTLLVSYSKNTVVSCKKKDVLNLQLKDYKNFTDDLTFGFVEAEKFLNEERIFSSRDLPYTTILKKSNMLDVSNIRNKLRQWYWCGVFGELYGTANETRYVKDVVDFVNWINGGDLPKTVLDSNFSPMRLTTLQTRNSAAYKGFMALILQNSAKDFISGKAMDFISYQSENIDIHHIFPQIYCEKNNLNKRKWNSIINKTPLSYKTNRKIGGNAPSKYLASLSLNVSQEDLINYLQSHLINPVFLMNNDFDSFIASRAGCLLDAVENATGKKILGRDSDEVKKFFRSVI